MIEFDPDFWDMNDCYNREERYSWKVVKQLETPWRTLSVWARLLLIFKKWEQVESPTGLIWIYKLHRGKVYLLQESCWIGGLP